jgi:3-oxoacyl-[acyl-carrier protein] reductase
VPTLPEHPLDGQTAAVTGAGQGLGRSIAQGLASAGADVAVLEVNEASGRKAVEELDSLGSKSSLVVVDISQRDQVEAAFNAIDKRYGALDILVNNAGISRAGPETHDVTDDDWLDSIAVMQSGVFYCMRAASRIMIRQRSGSIINVSSIRGFSPRPGRMTYSVPKAAVLMMTKIAASEWGRFGIRVNAVAPGFIKTPMHDVDVARGTFDEQALLDAIPLGRLGAPDDLAKLVTFLASSEASYITGACVTIDGGLTTMPVA